MADLEGLHAELKELIGMIEEGRTHSKEGVSMVNMLARVDAMAGELEGAAPPMLMHYLEKRSYMKALDFLAGVDETAKPNC